MKYLMLIALCLGWTASLGISRAWSQSIADTRPSSRPSPESNAGDLTNLSLEDLMNVQVTSVSKQTERIADAPAAITVIDQEDISRSGMNTIPDLLRLVPGLNVAKLDASKWAIGARGFSAFFSNKFLVEMDGRSLYSPQFGGVYWNAQDYIMDDLDRVEVIRGPGATIWGANAVDGVVNITTKSADQTQGWLLSGLGGNEQQDGSVRYGGKIDSDTYYRVYTKYSNYDNSVTPSGGNAFDSWNSAQSGFRIDRYSSSADTQTLQGDVYNQDIHQTDQWVSLSSPFMSTVNDSAHADGGNILGRWTHQFSDTSSFSVQTYYDRLDHHDLTLAYQQDTGDVDFHHDFALGDRQQIIWGGGYRFYSTRADGSTQIEFTPNNLDLQLMNAFVQDDITLARDRLHFFLGSKVEDDTYSGAELEPGARLLFTPDEHQSFWGAISRSTRTPSRYEDDSNLRFAAFPNGANPVLLQGEGNTDLESEKLMNYELGYRFEPGKTFSVDSTAFFNDYNNIINNQTDPGVFVPAPPAHVLVSEPLTNNFSAQTFGGEIEATWRPADNLKLIGSYSYLDGYERDNTGHYGPIPSNSSLNQFQLRSYLDLARNVQFNTLGFYQSSQDAGAVPGFFRLDANIGWQPTPQLNLMVGVQNILDNHHPETSFSSFVVQTEVPRTYFARMSYKF